MIPQDPKDPKNRDKIVSSLIEIQQALRALEFLMVNSVDIHEFMSTNCINGLGHILGSLEQSLSKNIRKLMDS